MTKSIEDIKKYKKDYYDKHKGDYSQYYKKCKYCNKIYSKADFPRCFNRMITCGSLECRKKLNKEWTYSKSCPKCGKNICWNANKCHSCVSKGKNNPFYGKVHTFETKKNFKLSRAKQIIPIKDTQIELKIQDFLRTLHIEFTAHYYTKEITHAYQCDIIIPSSKTILECDGDYWHGNPNKYPVLSELQQKQREKDEIRTKELQERGFRVIRLWESYIKKMDVNILNNIIRYGIT